MNNNLEEAVKPIDFKDGKLLILDQKELPFNEIYLEITEPYGLIKAIKELSIRGAPLLGLAGIYGLYFASLNCNDFSDLENYSLKIRNARPTAVNLPNTVDNTMNMLKKIKDEKNMREISEILVKEAGNYKEKLIMESQNISKHGLYLIDENDSILTHCNTGTLAVLGYGTALGIIKYAYKEKKNIKIYFTETRPLLQGSRLTSFELVKNKIPATLIVDSAVGYLMKEKKINKVIVGADRIAKNGDTANKIGTYQIALLAKAHNIPFYVAAPKDTFDQSISSGANIPIEYRDQKELKEIYGIKLAPAEVEALNPAFDVTPRELITAFITEEGIIY